MERVIDKVALVTGAARGIGAAVAARLHGEGARVTVADVLEQEGKETAERLGSGAMFVRLDVTSPADWDAAVKATVDAFGGLSTLVNNAGIVNFASIEDFTLDQWNTVLAVNLTGTFNGIKAAIPALKQSKGSSIINISSIAGLRGYENIPGYTASKFGVRGLTKSVALDLGRYGIRVNSVHPGVISTPMTAGLAMDMGSVALGREGHPGEVANLVLYLASDEASYITGSEFVIDGGDTAGTVTPPEEG
ncbi:short-chain dehydrogenase/reductase SDR [Pseudarthrobacter chlorophenolicus A6]|uniref:Short-chain dehydrogenase/reductase SDR n=1 Tax=Pseudarthrobacter chlorophenolicus (strain ATCC 700700 / DSM 12829 / CIP 107037 / JCM 12360 / KCTC 9906 / NCIMB 13794 / A6) TaxID=452863 RepID=B8H6V6_PSECP|nr:glucose 1-dehydrogenase [Pseudarthrobacter chlorophenolicus]ACL39677.1 short-chain dehydrogenase/reductase SDR [Pseudarthrobacter chlorophenolicus A6]SDQ95584.1 3alpha(or 20beta)-hydroxysteroid dehydrogenase [Pseudarthrobacter chlorophenolicus]